MSLNIHSSNIIPSQGRQCCKAHKCKISGVTRLVMGHYSTSVLREYWFQGQTFIFPHRFLCKWVQQVSQIKQTNIPNPNLLFKRTLEVNKTFQSIVHVAWRKSGGGGTVSATATATRSSMKDACLPIFCLIQSSVVVNVFMATSFAQWTLASRWACFRFNLSSLSLSLRSLPLVPAVPCQWNTAQCHQLCDDSTSQPGSRLASRLAVRPAGRSADRQATNEVCCR